MVDVIFVDSTAWWALLDKKDKNHKKAQEIWNNFKENSLMPITTDFIIYNLADKLNSELSYNQALEFLKVINSSKALKILRTEEETLQEVTKLFQAAKDNKQKLNFTDFIIIQLMRQLEINCLFTFNKWFKEYDIITIP